jgi:hypothetical protein
MENFSRLPSIFERSGTKATILERTPCRCVIYPHDTNTIFRIRLLEGKHAGAEVWACTSEVGQFVSIP